MLRPLIFAFFLLFHLATNGFAAKDDRSFKLNQDLTWVREMNLQAAQLSKTYQEEARAIVKGAINAASQQKHCEAAEALTHKAEEIEHNSLSPNEDSARYPELLVFVSFSMPHDVIKALGNQVNHVGGKLVFRGLINGNFKDTIEKLKELQLEVMIDPTLYESYQITRVPVFILKKKRKENAHEDGCYDRLSGNVSLHYVLDQFASHGNQEATQILEDLRRKP